MRGGEYAAHPFLIKVILTNIDYEFQEEVADTTLMERMTAMWDCYWPFVRRYGDSMAAAFEVLPKVYLPPVSTAVVVTKATYCAETFYMLLL